MSGKIEARSSGDRESGELDRGLVLEMVVRLAASGHAHAQGEAIRLAQRYRDIILSKPAPALEPGSELSTAMAETIVP